MLRSRQPLLPLNDRGPLRVLFLNTSMPVGGAETLLVNLVQRLDSEHFLPEICCLKDPGPLGESLMNDFPVHSNLLANKFDLRIWPRLTNLLRTRRIDAVVTVGAGDKMFWGRLSAWRAGVPVILSALHSTGWPDNVGRLNRVLTPITDALIAVAESHGQYLRDVEQFPAAKVRVIPNGIDVERFRPRPNQRTKIRQELGLAADAPVCGIVAALRVEKNHELFLTAAARVRDQIPTTQFVIVGDGPQRQQLEQFTSTHNLAGNVHFLGSRSDIPELLSALDVFSLTSHNEANPVSILEALATEVPVVATRVGSVDETVHHGRTGFLADPGDASALADHWITLLENPEKARAIGKAGRALVVRKASLQRMVTGYEELIREIYISKCGRSIAVPLPVKQLVK